MRRTRILLVAFALLISVGGGLLIGRMAGDETIEQQGIDDRPTLVVSPVATPPVSPGT